MFLNGARVGDIRAGETLQFSTTKATNMVKVGKLNGNPFYWPESGYFFDASQATGTVNLEITLNNLLVTLQKI
jgi:hypothetical protein